MITVGQIVMVFNYLIWKEAMDGVNLLLEEGG